MGRQFTIPLLFAISGAALSFSRGSTKHAVKKIVIVTVIGMGINACLWFSGPQDNTCSFEYRAEARCKDRGVLLDFVFAPHAPPPVKVIFQMWYTLMLLAVIAEDFILWWFIRQVHDRRAQPVLVSVSAWAWFLGRLVFVALFWIYLTQQGDDALLKSEVAGIIALEVVFDLLLAASARCSVSQPRCARLLQYLAAAVAVLQFGWPDFEIHTVNGNLLVYYHFFKQALALGFTMTLTGWEVKPLFSRIWPVTLYVFLFLTPSTNFLKAGMPNYPWYPRILDRMLYLAGTFVWVFVVDRVGRAFTQLDICAPCPAAIRSGALVAYVVHPLGIALLAPTLDALSPNDIDPVVWMCVVLIVSICSLACWAAQSLCRCRRSPRAA